MHLNKLYINVQPSGRDGVKKQMQPAMRLQMSTIVLSRSVQFITRFTKNMLRITFPAFFISWSLKSCDVLAISWSFQICSSASWVEQNVANKIYLYSPSLYHNAWEWPWCRSTKSQRSWCRQEQSEAKHALVNASELARCPNMASRHASLVSTSIVSSCNTNTNTKIDTKAYKNDKYRWPHKIMIVSAK